MKASVYEVLRTTELTHWFCDDSQERAMTAVVTDRSIQETVKKYMSGMTVKIEAMEGKLETKANITDFEVMALKIEKLEKRIEDTVDQPHEAIAAISISEIKQRQKRKDNIVVFDLDESDADTAEDRKNQDSQAVQKVLEKIETASNIKDPIRIGKKGWKTPSSESDCPRPITTEKNTEPGEYTGKSRRAVKKGIHQEGHDTDRTTEVQKPSGRERQQEKRSNRERRERRSVVNLVRESGEAQASTTRGRLKPNKECTENKLKNKNIISSPQE